MTTGLTVFDTTVQQSNEWLRDVEQALQPCDRHQAYTALRAVLHTLRDRLPLAGVLGLSAQLPMLLRGMFLEGWRPAEGVLNVSEPQAFNQVVFDRLPPQFPREASGAVRAVFDVVADRLDPGEVAKLIQYLPTSLHGLWPSVYRPA